MERDAVGLCVLGNMARNCVGKSHSMMALSSRLLAVLTTTVVIGSVVSLSLTLDRTDSTLHAHHQHQLIFPLLANLSNTRKTEQEIGNSLSSAFEALVGSSEYMIQQSSLSATLVGHHLSSCRMPDFGDLATITFSPRLSTYNKFGNPTEYILFAFDFDCPLEDFGMLCLEIYRYRADIQHAVCLNDLESNVLDFLNSRPPDVGIDAEFTSCEVIGNEKFGLLLKKVVNSDALEKLQREGFVVIDNVLKTSQSSMDKFDKLTRSKGRGNEGRTSRTGVRYYRTDNVAFLNRENALDFGIEDQYDFLLTLASHLNNNLDFELYASPYTPLFPGTKERPLTNPSGFNVQIAEFIEGQYYVAHSDNSFDFNVNPHGVFGTRANDNLSPSSDSDRTRRRSNYRCITAILYMNEGWVKADGGQLRLYQNSAVVLHPHTVLDGGNEYIDINPSNGKLLLFDSRMIHSVENVFNKNKTRRALTLWMVRPEESGATGEDYFLIGDYGGIVET